MHEQHKGNCCGPTGHAGGFGKQFGHGFGKQFGQGFAKMFGPGGMGLKSMVGCVDPTLIHNIMDNWKGFMPYDLEETDGEYIVTTALPGFEVKNIDVSVKGNTILIEAKKEIPTEEVDPEKKTRKITSMGGFIWSRPLISVKVPVAEEIDSESVKAKLSRGILKITFKKIPGKKVNVEEEIE